MTDDGPHFLLEETRGRDVSDAPQDTRGRRRLRHAALLVTAGLALGALGLALNEWDQRRQAAGATASGCGRATAATRQRRRRSCHSSRGILLVRQAVTYTPSAGLTVVANACRPTHMNHTEQLKALDDARWRIAIALTIAMMVLYFGFILLVAYAKPLLGRLVVPGLSLGMLLGALVIVAAWVLIWIYVRWANTHYDAAIDAFRGRT